MKKAERVIISVSNNGYVVENPYAESDYGRMRTHTDTWTFESMKKLQERLPEIMDIPHEKRPPTK